MSIYRYNMTMQIYFGNKEVTEYEDKLEAIKTYFFKKKVIKKGSKSEVIRRLIDLVYNSEDYKKVMNGIIPPKKLSKNEQMEDNLKKTLNGELFTDADQVKSKRQIRVLTSSCAGQITPKEWIIFKEKEYSDRDNNVYAFITEVLGYDNLESFYQERKVEKLRGSK